MTIQHLIGEKVIIRTESAGVWYGLLKEKSGDEVVLTKARRLWYWHAEKSISLSGVALYGVKRSESKITAPVESVWLRAIEIMEVSEKGKESLDSAPEVEAR